MLTRLDARLLEKLRSYQPSTDDQKKNKEQILRQFSELNGSFRGHQVVSAFFSETKETKEEPISVKVEALRKLLSTVMAEEQLSPWQMQVKASRFPPAQRPQSSSSRNFYDLVFDLQLALSRRFPTNKQIGYELALTPLDQKPKTFGENTITLYKKDDQIDALPQDAKSTPSQQLTLSEREMELLLFPSNKQPVRMITQSQGNQQKRLIDKIRLVCGYPRKADNLFEMTITGEEIALDSGDLVMTSQGLLYTKAELTGYFNTNNAYTRDSLLLRFPDRNPVSEREYYSLLAQGVQIPRPDEDRLWQLRGLAGGQRFDRPIDFSDTNLAATYSMPGINYVRTRPQYLAYMSGIFLGAALGAATLLVGLWFLPPAITNMSFITAIACGLIDKVRNKSFYESLIAVQMILTLCFGLAWYIFPPLFSLLALHSLISPAILSAIPAVTDFILTWTPVATVALHLGMVRAGKSLSELFFRLTYRFFNCLYTTTGGIAAIAFLGLAKLAEGVCQLFSSAEPMPAPAAARAEVVEQDQLTARPLTRRNSEPFLGAPLLASTSASPVSVPAPAAASTPAAAASLSRYSLLSHSASRPRSQSESAIQLSGDMRRTLAAR